MGYIFLGGYIGSIFLANWLLATFGVLFVGLPVPAGTLSAGLAFTFRDLVQESLGRWVAAGAIVLGACLSAFVSPQLALASGLTFLVSEGLDFLVYTPLSERHWHVAVAASNTVGLLADSVMFLTLAWPALPPQAQQVGFPLLLAGQIVGKLATTLLALLVLGPLRRSDVAHDWKPTRVRGAGEVV